MAKSKRSPPAIRATARSSSRIALGAAILLAFSVGASATGWGLRLFARPQPVPAGALPTGRLGVDALAAAAPLLFGEREAQLKTVTNRPSRFELLGVIGGGSIGAALIGIDGKSPRAVAVGADAAPGVTLVSTGWREAWLRDGGARIELKMRAAAAAAAGATPAEPPHTAAPAGMAQAAAEQQRPADAFVVPSDNGEPDEAPRPRRFPPPKLPGA